MVAVGECTTEPAQADDVGVAGRRSEYQRVSASYSELDPAAGRQIFQPGIAQG
jgi:hypothetical protein